jgi:hypothetical protein
MLHTRSLRAACGVASCLLGVLTSPARADVLTVDYLVGGADFPEIQLAIDAAQDGDVILVLTAGGYLPFTIDDKAVSVVADSGVVGVVNGSSTVRNLSPGKQVLLSGLQFQGDVTGGVGLMLEQNSGSVRVQGCKLQGADTLVCVDGINPGWGFSGATVVDCSDVAFSRCIGIGGDGVGDSYGSPCYVGGRGGDGIEAVSSNVSVLECILTGGRGGDENGEGLGGDGGAGIRSSSQRIWVMGSLSTGGEGGFGFDFIPVPGHGNGGDGLSIGSGSAGYLLDNTFVGGGPGLSAFGVPGDPGEPIESGGGPVTAFTGEAHALILTPSVAREGQTTTFLFLGSPGDVPFLLLHVTTAQLPVNSLGGNLMLAFPLLLGPLPMGIVPGSGTLEIPVPVAELGPGVEAAVIHIQSLTSEAEGLRLGASSAFILLDGAIPHF